MKKLAMIVLFLGILFTSATNINISFADSNKSTNNLSDMDFHNLLGKKFEIESYLDSSKVLDIERTVSDDFEVTYNLVLKKRNGSNSQKFEFKLKGLGVENWVLYSSAYPDRVFYQDAYDIDLDTCKDVKVTLIKERDMWIEHDWEMKRNSKWMPRKNGQNESFSIEGYTRKRKLDLRNGSTSDGNQIITSCKEEKLPQPSQSFYFREIK